MPLSRLARSAALAASVTSALALTGCDISVGIGDSQAGSGAKGSLTDPASSTDADTLGADLSLGPIVRASEVLGRDPYTIPETLTVEDEVEIEQVIDTFIRQSRDPGGASCEAIDEVVAGVLIAEYEAQTGETAGSCEEVYRAKFDALSPENQEIVRRIDEELMPQVVIEQVPEVYEGYGIVRVAATVADSPDTSLIPESARMFQLAYNEGGWNIRYVETLT